MQALIVTCSLQVQSIFARKASFPTQQTRMKNDVMSEIDQTQFRIVDQRITTAYSHRPTKTQVQHRSEWIVLRAVAVWLLMLTYNVIILQIRDSVVHGVRSYQRGNELYRHRLIEKITNTIAVHIRPFIFVPVHANVQVTSTSCWFWVGKNDNNEEM